MKTPTALSVTSSQREQTSLRSQAPRLPRSNVCSTPDLENPSASVHRKRFSTPSLTLKFLCAGKLNPPFKILDDAEVTLATRGRTKLAIPMRRVRLKRDDGGTLTLITNDLERSAIEIAALYKTRWQIELLFRWLKQHLGLRKFFGRRENA